WRDVLIMLHGRESDGPQRVVTATQRASRPPLPPAAHRKTALVAFRFTPPLPAFCSRPSKSMICYPLP
ncbi:hypothetical protein, partial [Escherichia coli]|uniref:hypothetical protein n=1 Tax=Escherichia coli TaxID=562 RepID=UPI0022829A0B